MNEKKSIQDILSQIADESGATKKLTESFLRTLFEIAEEALMKDGIAKIPNLGTFKVVAIEERKSVNVQDGSEMIIPAHKKVTFTPEKNLKEDINKPYAHLETYVLKDDGPVDPDIDDNFDEDEVMEEVIPTASVQQNIEKTPIQEVAEVATTTDSLYQEEIQKEDKTPIQKETIKETTNETIMNDKIENEQVQSAENSLENNVTNTESTVQETIAEEQPSTQNEVSSETETTEGVKEEIATSTEKSEVEEKPQQTEVAPSTPQPKKKQPAKAKEEPKSKKWLLWLLLGLLLVLGILFAVKYLMDKQEAPTVKEEVPVKEAPATPAKSEDDDFIEEPQPAIDCFENTDQCIVMNELEQASKQEAEEEEDNATYNAATHSFDDRLVNYMNENHPELNFPKTVGIKEEYTVPEGSRLAQISRNIYKGVYNYWGYLYFFNTDVLSSPSDIKPGMKLKIPDLEDKFVNPSSEKCKKIADEVNNKLLK